jgi:hypothetical protein
MLGAVVRIAPLQDCEARFFVDSFKRFISILSAYYHLFLSIGDKIPPPPPVTQADRTI